jgi:integrase
MSIGANMPRKGDYLFKRQGSQNWYIRIQYPQWLAENLGRKKLELSLETPDRDEAEIKAAEYIADHKRILFLRRVLKRTHHLAASGPKRFEPGKIHHLPDGGIVVASEDKIDFFDENNTFVRTETNTNTANVQLAPTPHEIRQIEPYLAKKKSTDDDIIKHWIEHRNINDHLAREARKTWSQFKALTKNKPLAKCTRKDGIALANLLLSSGNNSSTVEKKVGHLRAAVNLHMVGSGLTANPFHKVTPVRDDRLIRVPLSKADMQKAAESMHRLSGEDQLLWKLLATTGMRLNEAFQINEEHQEEDIRYVHIGTKTASSNRRIPIPTELLDLIPPRIIRPLFNGRSEVAGKRLIYFLKRLEISHDRQKNTGDRRKVVHSLRHRAKDRLRALACPLDIQYEILGHEKQTVAAGYGHGYPISTTLSYIDKIGY